MHEKSWSEPSNILSVETSRLRDLAQRTPPGMSGGKHHVVAVVTAIRAEPNQFEANRGRSARNAAVHLRCPRAGARGKPIATDIYREERNRVREDRVRRRHDPRQPRGMGDRR